MPTPDDHWLPPPRAPVLGDAEVHVWRAALDVSPERRDELAAALSGDEREKVSRFYQARHRHHYAAGRGWLRSLLAAYLGGDPARFRFVCNESGKPALAAEQNPADFQFNLSHSHGLALFAFARGRAVGVDVERVRPDFATDEVAARFFAPGEVARLRAWPAAERTRAFFDCWARKEAYLKARGDGIFHGLDRFEVAFTPEEPPALLHVADDPGAGARWTIFPLPPLVNYAAALVVAGRDLQLKCWRAERPPIRF